MKSMRTPLSQHSANTTLKFLATGHAGAPLCTTLAKAPENRHDSFTPQHLASASWALATEELAGGVLLSA